MKNRLIVAAVFVPLLFVIIFFLPDYAFAVMVAVICAVASYEFQHAVGARSNERVGIYGAFSAALIPIGAYLDVGAYVFTAVLLLLMCLLFFEAIKAFGKKRQIALSQILTVIFGSAVIPYMLSSLVSLRNIPEGRLYVLLPLIAAFVTDAGAYLTGVTIGKKQAFPLVSPKKTIEGCVGGIVTGIGTMLLYGMLLVAATPYEIRFSALFLYGIVGAAVTELGDLAFSLVKREFEIKDYGRLLPGHGGMLDRFDSMVFAAPAVHLLVTAIPCILQNNAA